MEINKFYKVIYKDDTYSKVAKGKLVSEDAIMICIEDRKDGKTWIGKKFIVTIKELGE